MVVVQQLSNDELEIKVFPLLFESDSPGSQFVLDIFCIGKLQSKINSRTIINQVYQIAIELSKGGVSRYYYKLLNYDFVVGGKSSEIEERLLSIYIQIPPPVKSILITTTSRSTKCTQTQEIAERQLVHQMVDQKHNKWMETIKHAIELTDEIKLQKHQQSRVITNQTVITYFTIIANKLNHSLSGLSTPMLLHQVYQQLCCFIRSINSYATLLGLSILMLLHHQVYQQLCCSFRSINTPAASSLSIIGEGGSALVYRAYWQCQTTTENFDAPFEMIFTLNNYHQIHQIQPQPQQLDIMYTSMVGDSDGEN
ncbi:hypothetical protein ACTA71_005341 [Dictyostelium dimigraforme]